MFTYYKLFDYLRKHNIKQKDLLSDKVISNGTLQRLRQNESVNTAILDALCDYLDCDLNDIVDYQKNEKKEAL